MFRHHQIQRSTSRRYVPSFNSMLSQVMMDPGAPAVRAESSPEIGSGISESSVPHSYNAILGAQGYLYQDKWAVVLI